MTPRSFHRFAAARKAISLARLRLLKMSRDCGRSMASRSPTKYLYNEYAMQLELKDSLEKADKWLSRYLLMFVEFPLKLMSNKFQLWQLKMLWDSDFNEQRFMDNAKQAVSLITTFIANNNETYVKRCTTPMGFKQIKFDLLRLKTPYIPVTSQKLLNFEKRHICAIPLNVQRLEQYAHKFAFVDIIFLASRRINDFESPEDVDAMQELIMRMTGDSQIFVPYPVVSAEIFVRFRRDYSQSVTRRAGHWLISAYNILRLDVSNYHPLRHGAVSFNEILKAFGPLCRTSSTTLKSRELTSP